MTNNDHSGGEGLRESRWLTSDGNTWMEYEETEGVAWTPLAPEDSLVGGIEVTAEDYPPPWVLGSPNEGVSHEEYAVGLLGAAENKFKENGGLAGHYQRRQTPDRSGERDGGRDG